MIDASLCNEAHPEYTLPLVHSTIPSGHPSGERRGRKDVEARLSSQYHAMCILKSRVIYGLNLTQ